MARGSTSGICRASRPWKSFCDSCSSPAATLSCSSLAATLDISEMTPDAGEPVS